MRSNDFIDKNVMEVIQDLRRRLEALECANTKVSELSEIAPDTGTLFGGVGNEIRIYSDPDSPSLPGEGFTGVRIIGSFAVDGVQYAIVGLNDDVLQAGFSAEDGTILAGAGAVILDASGITADAGTIAGWSITTEEIKKNGIILNSTNDIIYVGSAVPRIMIDGANKLLKSSNFSSGAAGFQIDGEGNAEFNNIKVRGEIMSGVFIADEVSATAGTQGVYKSAGTLLNDVTTVASPTTFNVDIEDPQSGHSQLFAAGDVLRLKNGSDDNWVSISSVSDQTTYYRYVCVLESGSAATFTVGQAVVDYGQSGDGWIELSAAGVNVPVLTLYTHSGSPWSDAREVLTLGNLGSEYGLTGKDSEGNEQFKIDNSGRGSFAAGNILLNNDGIIGTDLLKYIIKQTATNGANTRIGKLSMVLKEGGSVPVFQLSIESPSGAEMMDNGDAEDGDFTSWTKTTEINGAWTVDSAIKKAGSYSFKWAPTEDGDGNSKSLLHFDGADASTTFTDASGKVWTPHGDAQIDTDQSVFGGASGLFDGTGDYIDTPDSEDWNLGSGDFEFEFRFRMPALSAGDTIFSQNPASPSAANRSISCFIDALDSSMLVVTISDGSSNYSIDSGTGFLSADTQYAVSVSRYGNDLVLRVDGTTISSLDITGVTIVNSSAKFTIGRFGEDTAPGNYYAGWIDEWRFTKGAVRHTADYTPAVAAYEDVKTEGVLTSDRVAVSASTDYAVLASLYCDGGYPGTIRGQVKWYDDPSAGSLLQTDLLGDANAQDSWINFDVPLTSPAGAQSCEIVLTTSESEVYNIYFDEMSIKTLSVMQRLWLDDNGVNADNWIGIESPYEVNLWGYDVLAYESDDTPLSPTIYQITNMYFNYYMAVSNIITADGDYYVWDGFILDAGTYTLTILGRTGSGGGKFDVYIDDVKVSSSPLNFYNGSAQYNQQFTATGLTISTSGRHTLKLVANGSDGSYYSNFITKLRLRRTGS